MSIRDLAEMMTQLFPEKGLKVIPFEQTTDTNYLKSNISRNCPDISKIKTLGWEPYFSVIDGFRRTVLCYVTNEIEDMKINEVKKEFLAGKISKQEFIKNMHCIHSHLFEYAEYLKDTDISGIEIIDGKVIMTSRSGGIKMLVDKDDERVTPIETLNFGEYETEELSFIANYIRKHAGPEFTVLDIGGNIGWYSINLAKAFPKINIHTFEPIPKTFGYLKSNIELNNIKNVKINNFGLSDKEKDITFYYYKEGSGNASLTNLSGSESVEEINTRVYRVDDYVSQNKLHIDFIKCDVEGAELFVFKGASATLKKQKPVVLTEMLRKWAEKFGYHPNDIIAYFTKLGYECFTISGKSLKPFHKVDEYTLETNFVFIHPDKLKL